jgi:ApbE superfamily uncharacterized protein (UPF0280 family)
MKEVEDYRWLVTGSDLVSSRVRIRESDLLVRADRDLARSARTSLARCRGEVEEYLFRHPEWGRSLVPVPAGGDPPAIIAAMSRAAAACGVGPMATVAGALAWFVGRELSALCGEVIVENGGDLYLDCRRERTILVRTVPESAFPARFGIRIPARPQPFGAAASSGTGGRSLSWGRAAAAVVLATDSLVADGAATALGNRVRRPERGLIETAVEAVAAIPSVLGCLAVCGDLLAARGDIELVELDDPLPGGDSR